MIRNLWTVHSPSTNLQRSSRCCERIALNGATLTNMAAMTAARPLVVAILDGWGIRDEREANAIALARTPILDRLTATSSCARLEASGEALGLAADKPGYMQAAYATIGAGRPLPQPAPMISHLIQEQGAASLATQPIITELVSSVRRLGGTVHLIGMVSPSGILGHQNIFAVLAAMLSHEGVDVQIHAVTDGIDTGCQSGVDQLREFLDDISGTENALLATLMGRAYGFDEPCDPDLVARAVKLLVDADGPTIDYPTAYLADCYLKQLHDDRIPPAMMTGYRGIRADDAVLLVNLSAETAQTLMQGIAARLKELSRGPQILSGAYSLIATSYADEMRLLPIFEMPPVSDTLGETLSRMGLTQLVLTESASASAFWLHARCGAPGLWPGETIMIADTPPLGKIEKRPDLAAASIAAEAMNAIKAGTQNLILLNFTNAALIGRTGNLRATIEAVEAVDKHLGKIAAQIEKRGGILIVTGSYGKAETMLVNGAKLPCRETTRAAVPFILAGAPERPVRERGTLADIAPTLLHLLGLRVPHAMTGQSLLTSPAKAAAHHADRPTADANV